MAKALHEKRLEAAYCIGWVLFLHGLLWVRALTIRLKLLILVAITSLGLLVSAVCADGTALSTAPSPKCNQRVLGYCPIGSPSRRCAISSRLEYYRLNQAAISEAVASD
jgi:hypothetical protein